MFLKKLKNIILNIDKKLFKYSIINTYLKIYYFLKVRKIYATVEKSYFINKKHTLDKELIISLTSYSQENDSNTPDTLETLTLGTQVQRKDRERYEQSG